MSPMDSILTPQPVFKRRYIPKVKKHEEALQLAVCRSIRNEFPNLNFHGDYAAGMMLSYNQARVRRAMQSGRGWSDIFIPYPSRGYHGLFIELKKEGTVIYATRGPRKGKLVANEQIQIEAAFLAEMNKLEYFARFACGHDKTMALIRWYMEVPQNAKLF